MTTNEPYEPIDRFLTCAIALIVILVFAILVSACSPRVIETIHTEYRDTTIYKELIRDSIIQVPIPLESNQAIVCTDDTSHLETSVAVSDAFVTGDGRLHHTLANRHDATLLAIVPIHYHSTATVAHTETTQIVTRTVEVEKPLSKWKSWQLAAFPWLLGLLGLAGLWTFRKPILRIFAK